MSLHGGSTSPPDKKKRSGLGGFKPAGGGTSSGSTYAPPRSSTGSTYTPPSSTPSGGSSPFGGFKFPGMGGPGGGGIWGKEPEGPGFTANWTESTRLMVAIGAFVVIALAAGLLVFGILKGGKGKTQAQPKPTANVTKFVPPTTSAGGKTQTTIVFSDGTTADLQYEPSLNLADLGVSLFDSGTLGQFDRAGRQFEIDHGGATFVANEPTASVTAGQVLPAPSPTQGNFLDFHFGDWRVGVWEGADQDLMSSTDDQTWAASMTGTQTSSGFLVLTAKSPLKMAPFGSSGGPQIAFGDITSTGVLLTPDNCVPPVGANLSNNANGVPVRIALNGNNHYEGDLCLKNVKMEALIYGDSNFVHGIADSLTITNLKPGPAR